MSSFIVPVLGIVAAHSNSGKTTLIETLIPLLSNKGIRVSVLKHVHHRIDLDSPGKDSYRFRQAGATQVMVASDQRWALLTETGHSEPSLEELIGKMDHSSIDLILVEGLREVAYPKIEVTLDSSADELVCVRDSNVIALASAHRFEGIPTPQMSIKDPIAISNFVVNWLNGTK